MQFVRLWRIHTYSLHSILHLIYRCFITTFEWNTKSISFFQFGCGALHIGWIQVGVLKIHNSGLVTSTSSNNNVGNNGNNSNIKTIQIQSSPSQQTIANAQVCLDSMALSDVDVRILTILHIYLHYTCVLLVVVECGCSYAREFFIFFFMFYTYIMFLHIRSHVILKFITKMFFVLYIYLTQYKIDNIEFMII